MLLDILLSEASAETTSAVSEIVDTVVDEPVISSAEDVINNTVEEVATFWSAIGEWLFTHWPSLLIAAGILVFGWLLVKPIIRLMKRSMMRAGIEKSAYTFITSVTKYTLYIILIICALFPFGINFTSVFAALGAAGLGLGLGLKEPVANIASGIILIITKPFTVGHYIAINDIEGTVTKIEVMFTTLKTLESQEIVIPNGTLSGGTVTNFTSLGVRRAEFNFNLQYGSDLNYIRNLLLDIAKNNSMVLEDPIPRFVILGQKPDGISCSLRVFCKPEDYWLCFWAINESISNAFANQGIRVPFSQLDVHIVNPIGSSGGNPSVTADSTPKTDCFPKS